MKCIMFGLACDKLHFEKYIKERSQPYSVAQYLFETELISQMETEFEIFHYYIYQSNIKKQLNKIILPKTGKITKKTNTVWINYRNDLFIKYFSIYLSTIKILKEFIHKYGNDFFVISTINYLPVAAATQFISKKYKIKNYIIFTDCSESFAYDGETNLIKKYLKKIYKKIVKSLEIKYDGYINFSPAMNKLVNPYNKPSIVCEGFLNANELDLNFEKKYSKFIILFAGSLLPSMGIQNLIQAFKKISQPDIELWIAGDGSGRDELIRFAADDKRIRFMGFLNRKELFQIEKKSSLLVNTRNPEDAFTKYSFPSKTFEYLASGTPFLSTKLECYTDEYDEYIIFIKDNNPETIKREIEKIYKWKEKTRMSFGKKAQEFILQEKNSNKQCEKVIRFIKETI